MGRRNLPCSTVKAQTEKSTGARSASSRSACRRVSESLPPESATATRSPSRIILKRPAASPTFLSRVFSMSTIYYREGGSPSRTAAFDILRLVEQGGYASDLLYARGGLDARNAGLASEIVLGSLRVRSQLDFMMERLSGRAVGRLDAEVRIALRMGIFQLRYLDRVPAHAAVTESVELVKLARKKSAAGFVNAVLRKVNREPVVWPDRATEFSVPAWLLERWEQQYGKTEAEGIAWAALEEPESY